MNESLLNLKKFIEDFKLQLPNGTICFNATIYFNLTNNEKISTTQSGEVNIITSDNVLAIYFLNASLDDENFPDMINLKNIPVNYIQKKYLKIEAPGYTVSIFPLQ